MNPANSVLFSLGGESQHVLTTRSHQSATSQLKAPKLGQQRSRIGSPSTTEWSVCNFLSRKILKAFAFNILIIASGGCQMNWMFPRAWSLIKFVCGEVKSRSLCVCGVLILAWEDKFNYVLGLVCRGLECRLNHNQMQSDKDRDKDLTSWDLLWNRDRDSHAPTEPRDKETILISVEECWVEELERGLRSGWGEEMSQSAFDILTW